MMGLLVGLALLIAAAGVGQHVLRPSHQTHTSALHHAIGAGLLIWGLMGLIVGVIAGLHPTTCLWIVGLSAMGWIRPRVQVNRHWLIPVVLSCLLLAPSLWDVVGPIIGTDERYFHIGLPLKMLQEGKLLGGPLHPNGSRPLTLQIAYTAALSTPWRASAAGLHWWLSVACLALIIQLGKQCFGRLRVGVLAALVLALSTTFQQEAGAAGSDIPAAFAVLLALSATLKQQHRAAGLAAGLALSIKYTAAAPLLGIWMVMSGGGKARLKSAGLTLMVLAPWWLRNVAEGLHPLFPFAGWSEPAMTFQFLEKYGLGRTVSDFALLPWRMLFEADPSSFVFLGRIHPYALALLIPFPLVLTQPKFRPWIAASAAGLIGWAIGPHWLRYLIPCLPILVLTGAAIVSPIARSRASYSLLLSGLVLGGISGLKGYSWPGNPKEHTSAGDRALSFCNTVLSSDDRVALLFAWRSSDLKTKQLLGSVEDHIPTRHFLMSNEGREVEALVQAGATHALVRNTRFLPKTYWFLSPDTFTQEFRNPVLQLNSALLMKADLLFRSPTHSVYRLPTAD